MSSGHASLRLRRALSCRLNSVSLTSRPFHNQAAEDPKRKPSRRPKKAFDKPKRSSNAPAGVTVISSEEAKRLFAEDLDPGPDPKSPSWPVRSYESRLHTIRDTKRPDDSALSRLKQVGTPSPSHYRTVVLEGDPESFPGETAFLISDGPNQAVRGGFWTQAFSLLSGPPIPTTSYQPTPKSREAMTNYIQVATTPTADSGSSLILHFDHRRYLFGHLSEGTQRTLGQRKYALAKLENFFLSGQTKSAVTGGIVGMMLTVADVLDGSRREFELQNQEREKTGKAKIQQKGSGRIEIHGARNIAYNIAAARSFVFRKGMPIRPIELFEDPRPANPDPTTPDWEDDAVQVWKMPVIDGPPDATVSGTSRKRSHEVMSAEDDNLTARPAPADAPKDQAKINQQATAAVVEDMFNSNWSLDTLHEIKLHDVELPATIFVRKDGSLHKYQGPLPGDAGEVPNIDVLVRFPWPATRVNRLPPPPSRSDMSVCYVVKNRGRRGKFNPVAAKKYGVKPPKFKLLTAGQTVEGADGVQVTPDMVLGENIKPNGFAVLDIPSTAAVESFLARPEWTNATLMENVHLFYWLLGSSVVDDARIQKVMQERPDVKHIVLAPDASPDMLSMSSYAILLAKLRRIDPDRFPRLQFDNTVRDLSFIGPNVEAARSGMTAMLSPEFVLKNDDVVPFPTFAEVAEMQEEVLALADEAKAATKDRQFLDEIEQLEQDIPNRDAEIIPLGTGSALPSKYRNVSSTLIRVPQYGNYLLDCGENTIGQLRRAYPREELTSILQSLRCIFISHMHADHHLGTASLIRAWFDATAHMQPRPKLYIVCPRNMKYYLAEFERIEDIAFRHVIFRDRDLKGQPLAEHDPDMAETTGLASFAMVPVKHCKDSFAGVLAWPSGLKIAYSGDCRPSDKLVEAGKGATLLIHESTFDDDKRGDAVAKNHSTMSEALDVGYRMGARRILLTHFSQRYAKVPIVDKRQTESGADQVVLLAFDQMRVKLGEFRHAEKFLPALRRYFELNAE
ncbi:metallo-beta-lactamase superfamily protein [Colletotrichum karsti]|uniref:ribonuclease Z n=1 Tax=Colletotrichum karsti TaxID=1095194 RepID=A0A9P6I160_9PEZI|nr:metallo-beta-lactamase superfamily protein [Colletotrichum karsti]KAF9872966.1 metallo-beta-lactamase superfamily protein [Colletotrichum karsti]